MISVTVDVATVGTVTNQASVSSDTDDPDPSNNSASEDTEVLAPEIDLQIAKDDGGVSADAGETVVYTLDYANAGNVEATGVVLTETLPDHTAFDAAGSSAGWMDQGGGVYTLDVGALAAAANDTATFAVTVDDPVASGVERIENVASIADDGASGDDVNPDDNSASDTTALRTYHNQLPVGFEDLKDGSPNFNDFDYNDVVLLVDQTEHYNDQHQLTGLSLRIEAIARGAGFEHAVQLDLGIDGDAQVEIRRFDAGGGSLGAEMLNEVGAPIRGLVVFPSTADALPPFAGADGCFTNTEAGQPASMRTPGFATEIELTNPDPTLNPRVFDDPATTFVNEHDAGLYGFNILVSQTGNMIYHTWDFDTATEDVVSGTQYPGEPLASFPLEQAFVLPTDWKHPLETVQMWDSHPDFEPFIISGRTTNTDWPLANVRSDRVWPPEGETTSLNPTKSTSEMAGAKAASPIPATPIFGDLDDDGTIEIVYGKFLNLIEIYDARGYRRLAIDPFPDQLVDSQSSTVLVDLDGDGDGDLEIVRCYDNGAVVAYHHDGTEYLPATGERLVLEGAIKGTPAVGDLDGDGAPELIVQTGHNRLHVFSRDLAPLPGFPADLGGASIDIGGHYFLTPSPALADLGGDGALEIIAVSLSGCVHVLSGAGATVPGWPVELGERVIASPAIGDLNADGLIEIVIATENGAVHALTADGSALPGWPAHRLRGGTSSPVLADTDGDGRLDVYIGSYDGQLYAFGHDGAPLADYPRPTRSVIHASPFFADLDADGHPDPLSGSDAGALYQFNAPGPHGTPPQALTQTPSLIITAGSVGDVDADGLLEIAIGNHDGHLRIIQTDTAAPFDKALTWNGLRGTGLNQGQAPTQPIQGARNRARYWELYQ